MLRYRIKCVVGALLCAGLTAFAGVHDLSEAFRVAVFTQNPSATVVDSANGKWQFGKFVSEHGNFQLFNLYYNDGDFQGFHNGEKFDVPYIVMNVGTEAIAHGQDTGNLGYLLKPDEVMFHPGYNYQYVGFTLQVPNAGVYTLNLSVKDICKDGNGQKLWILTNNVEMTTVTVNAINECDEKKVSIDSILLQANDIVRVVVDPINGNIIADSTVVHFSLEDSATTPVADLAELLRVAAIANTLPLSTNGVTFDCGVLLTGQETPQSFDHAAGSVAPLGKGFRFNDSNGLPYVLANHTGTASPFVTPVASGIVLPPWQMACVPPNDGYTYVSVTAPSDGNYRAEMELLCCSQVLALTDEAYNYNFASGLGANGQILINHKDFVAGTYVCTTFGVTNNTLVVPTMALKKDDVVVFAINSRYNWSGDRLAFTAKLLATTQQLPTADTIINVDIDGYQAFDGAVTEADTFVGKARVGSANDFWNSLAVQDNTVNTVTKENLKNAAGESTSVSLTLASSDIEKTLGFDRLADGAMNTLLADYLYLYETPVVLTLNGLVPNATYDLYLFGATRKNTPNFALEATFGTLTKRMGLYQTFNYNNDSVEFEGCKADEQGAISITLSSTITEFAGILNGLQLVGPFVAQ